MSRIVTQLPSLPCRCSSATTTLTHQIRHRFSTVTLQRHVSKNVVKCLSSDREHDSCSHSRRSVGNGNGNGNGNNRVERKRVLRFKGVFGKLGFLKKIFKSNKVRSIVLLNLITIVYASNIPVVKEVEALTNPAAFTVVRFAASAIPFMPFVMRARNDVQTRNAGIELGFWVSLGYLFQAIGMQTSDAGRASFISMLTVVVVPLLDATLGASVPARTWFGSLMSLLGVAMLESSGSPPCAGDLFNFLSALFFGIHMLRTEHISRSTNKKNFLSLLGYEVCVIAFLSTIWYFIGGDFSGLQAFGQSSVNWALFWDWLAAFPWIPALYTGIFSTGLCLWVEMAAMRDVSATETAIIYALEPVWGASFAWFLLGERWGATGWVGAAFVLGGSLIVQIFGSGTSNTSKVEDSSDNENHQEVLRKQRKLSTSAVVVTSRKDIDDVLQK